ILRTKYCGPYQTAYAAWQKENGQKPVVSWAQQRVKSIDELTGNLAECVQLIKESAPDNSASRASKLVAQYEKVLEPIGDLKLLPPDKLQLVQDYFQAYARASEEFIQRQGRMAAASGAPLAPLAEVC